MLTHFRQQFNIGEVNSASRSSANRMLPMSAKTINTSIAKNPVRSQRLTNPGKESKGVHALPVEDMIDIMENIGRMSNPYEALYVALPFYVGLRREEVLGLKWEDIDWQRKRIHIQRAVTYPINQPIIKPPKTKSRNRLIAIPDRI